MKYLVDENISQKKQFLKDHPEYKEVKYEIEPGVKDPEIMKFLSEHKDYVLYTKDKRFALDALIEGHRVKYHDEETKKEFNLKVIHIKF